MKSDRLTDWREKMSVTVAMEKEQKKMQLPWMDNSLSAREKAEKLVEAMTLEQKISQLHGAMKTINIYSVFSADQNMNDMSVDEQEKLMAQLQIQRHVDGIEELGIPRFRITNGPVGVGMGDGYPSPEATALPMTIGLAAGFDKKLASLYGDIIGSETATLGQHVLEGPGVCLHRTPIAGRNFEYFSEDPYLSGVMGVEITKAIQDHNVIAMGKHFVVNDQEYERFRTSIEVDEHVLRELYLLPFEMLVKDAKIAAIMSAYNRIRGTYATENRHTLNDILRNEWGFEGYVQSDFWSCRSCAASLSAGMDHEMPDSKWCNEENVKKALEDTSLEIKTVDRALVRRFTQMFRFDQMGKQYEPGIIDAKKHGQISRKIGSEIAVLLKNDHSMLPLNPDAYNSVLIIGQSYFVDEACNGGGGSSKVVPLYTVTPVQGMKNVLKSLNSKTKVEKITVDQTLSNLNKAKKAAKEAEIVIIMAGIVATEGVDLVKPLMPHDQNRMVEEILDVNPNTVVVMKDSSPVLMPWADKAPAILEAWNQGSEDGHVVADLLFGVVNPSGKVPTTYAASEKDLLYYNDKKRYPGVNEGDGYPVIRYSEGLNMGYRWYQSQNIKPLFPFGFGLSYTSFELSEVHCDKTSINTDESVTIELYVTNTGNTAGAEVIQIYAGIDQDGQPPKRLVGFEKVHLEAGQSKSVSIKIDTEATNHPLSVWDYVKKDFVVRPGKYTFYIGTSSEDTPFENVVEVNANT